MPPRPAALALLFALAPAAASAASLDFNDKAFAEATVNMLFVDYLAPRCPDAKAGSPLAGKVAAWRAENRTASLRQAVDAARAQPNGERKYAILTRGVEGRLGPMADKACLMLEAWLIAPQSKMSTSQPAVYAALGGVEGGGGFAATPPPGPSAARAPTPGPAAAAASTPTAAQIGLPPVEGYGLMQTYGFGYGGMMVMNLEPAILFKSGEILTEIKAVAAPGGLEADKRTHPRNWSRWRKAGATYEYATQGGKWSRFFGDKVWASPPSPDRLSGAFRAVGGGGNTALGGTSAVFVQTTYQFLPGGRLVRQGFASGSSETEGADVKTSVVTSAKNGKAGRYTVDGLIMTIAYDDGSKEQKVLMTHPTDADIIWLNGVAYTHKK